jgi:hypothetical protein
MAVRRSKAKLTHPPRLVSRRLQYLRAGGYGSPMERVNVIDVEVRNVAVIAELAGGGNVRAATEHEGHSACATEAPVARGDVIELATQDIAIPSTGDL